MSAFLLAGGSSLTMVVSIVLGVALVLLSIPRGRRSKEHYAGWDRFVV